MNKWKLFWDAVTVVAGIGMIWGTWQYAEYLGWGKALLMAVACGVFGLMAMNMIYPFWFRD